MLSPVDTWAVTAASVSACGIGVRRFMLHPALKTWAAAPQPVQRALAALAIAMGMTAISIVGGAHATAREACVYTVLAVTAVVLALNLYLTGRKAGAEHATP